MPIVFEGFVLAPDGTPAADAAVTSSAGGEARAHLNGHYRLEARVPLDAEQVRIVALEGRGESGSASTSVELSIASGLTRLDPLLLAPGTNCQPEWLPTFGEQPRALQPPGCCTEGVWALAVVDVGGGPELYAGGSFFISGAGIVHLARWNGSNWSALGSGIGNAVKALAEFADGNGSALYVGGYFVEAGGVPASHVARWDGATWSALGSGVDGFVHALAVHDDGSGPALYVGGEFTTAGGITARRIAKWDGSSWSALGNGVGNIGPASTVAALAVFDDGGGPALYAGGVFGIAGSPSSIARWDGSSWSSLGGGVNSLVRALTAFDDGGGPALYAGGEFSSAGGVPTHHIAKWNGSSWSALGGGCNGAVRALATFHDGTARALYAGGNFSQAGGVAASAIARWDGWSWSALGDGVNSPIDALAVLEGVGSPGTELEFAL